MGDFGLWPWTEGFMQSIRILSQTDVRTNLYASTMLCSLPGAPPSGPHTHTHGHTHVGEYDHRCMQGLGDRYVSFNLPILAVSTIVHNHYKTSASCIWPCNLVEPEVLQHTSRSPQCSVLSVPRERRWPSHTHGDPCCCLPAVSPQAKPN